MRVERLVVGPLDSNCWVVSDDSGSPVLVIDPADEPDAVLAAIDDRPVAAVVLTHAHFDHLRAAGRIKEVTGAPLMVHADDEYRLANAELTGGVLFGFTHEPLRADRVLHDGDVIAAGGLRAEVLHTPGHTEGGISLYVPESSTDVPHLFSGDTLFARSVGRTDFPGGSSRELQESIRAKLAVLPGDTRVHPGHGPDTTIGKEVLLNPFFPRA